MMNMKIFMYYNNVHITVRIYFTSQTRIFKACEIRLQLIFIISVSNDRSCSPVEY